MGLEAKLNFDALSVGMAVKIRNTSDKDLNNLKITRTNVPRTKYYENTFAILYVHRCIIRSILKPLILFESNVLFIGFEKNIALKKGIMSKGNLALTDLLLCIGIDL